MNNKYVVRAVLVVVIVVVIAVAVFANPRSLTKAQFNPTAPIKSGIPSDIEDITIIGTIGSRIISDIYIDDTINYRAICQKIINEGEEIGDDIPAISLNPIEC